MVESSFYMDIVLCRPERPGNIGAVARAMKNFGFSSLVLAEPQCDPLADEAIHRAAHAKEILRKASRVSLKDLEYDLLIATTAQIGQDYNVPRVPLTPEKLATLPLHGRVGVLFGPEGHGLSNAQIQQCDFVVAIPTDKQYPTMNLSHAAAIILYELSKNPSLKEGKRQKLGRDIRYADAAMKQQILKLLEIALKKMPFITETKRDTQRKVWRRMIGKAFLTRREAMALMGFLKKIK